MKATIEFDLPEEEEDYHDLLYAKKKFSEYLSALCEIDQYTRSILKHGTNDSLDQILEHIRYSLIPNSIREG